MILEKLNSDKSREWVTIPKIIQPFRVLFSKRATQVLAWYRSFDNIDIELLKQNGIEWIILDVDECIAPHHGQILNLYYQKIQELLQAWFKIVIYSNMKKSSRYEDLEKLWIQVITSKYAKPDKRWFEECLERLWLNASEVAMVWDNYLTDWWAIWAWIPFIKIKPIETLDKKSISRRFQIWFRSMVDFVAQNIYKTLEYK